MESAILSIQKPVPLAEKHDSKISRIPCQKGKTRKKEMTYVIIEEERITDREREYAEQMLYEAILGALKDRGILTAEEVQACRERDLQRRKMKELNRHEEL